jgi:peptide/nickel transport system ATP-binding protein
MLEISDLCVTVRRGDVTRTVVNRVSLTMAEHEIVGVVGESGAGKSMMARSIVKLLPMAARITGGRVLFDGTDLLTCPANVLRSVRGGQIGVILQDPMSSLDPTMTIGKQVSEPLLVHGEKDATVLAAAAEAMLMLVGLPDAAQLMRAFPHQLSGGMRQRVAIAMALICRPKLLIADEPTTALDVTIQAQILEVLKNLRAELGLSILLISHDIGVVSSIADRIVVMYGGEVVEDGSAERVLLRPFHRYTESLLAAASGAAPPGAGTTPTHEVAQGRQGRSEGERCCFAGPCPAGDGACWAARPPWTEHEPGHYAACIHPPVGKVDAAWEATGDDEGWHVAATAGDHVEVLRVEDVSKVFPISQGPFTRSAGNRHAVAGVSFSLEKGENLAIIGESGCGKTTLARILVGLETPTTGRVSVSGREIRQLRRAEGRRARRHIQLMFQDPYASLDPRMRVLRSLREPLTVQGVGAREERNERVQQLLKSVGLSADSADLMPYEFSGGQRQRLAFARAVILNPDIVVADEPVSALDVSVRAQVLAVMMRLQAEHRLSYVIISHDISIVRKVADRTAVMYAGRIVEIGPTRDVLTAPRHPYTRGLLASVPKVAPGASRATLAVGVTGELSHDEDLSRGCPFRFRCPQRRDLCDTVLPALEGHGSARVDVACHFPQESGSLQESVR